MDILTCPPLFSGSMKDKDLFTYEHTRNTVDALSQWFVIFIVLIMFIYKETQQNFIGHLPNKRGWRVWENTSCSVFKIRQFVFPSHQVIVQLFASTTGKYLQEWLLNLQFKPVCLYLFFHLICRRKQTGLFIWSLLHKTKCNNDNKWAYFGINHWGTVH